jgi:hypothetical protein
VAGKRVSDHPLLSWREPSRPFVARTRSCFIQTVGRLDMAALQTSISSSLLCRPQKRSEDVDTLAAVYDSVLTSQLDLLLPIRQLSIVRGCLTPGSTRNVVMPSVCHDTIPVVVVIARTLKRVLWRGTFATASHVSTLSCCIGKQQ